MKYIFNVLVIMVVLLGLLVFVSQGCATTSPEELNTFDVKLVDYAHHEDEQVDVEITETEETSEPSEEQVQQQVQQVTNDVQTYQQPSTGSGNFMYDGVWYDDTYRYTWYSSNAAYHYRTSEWTAGDDGIYRDSDGYVVVASSDLPEGSVVADTPFGAAKVYDCGCPSGTLDVYTNY